MNGIERLTARRTAPPTAAPAEAANVFRLEGEYWTIAYDGAVVRLKNSKGLCYLAHLLRDANKRVAACDLVAATETAAPQALTTPSPHALPVYAERARLAVTKRIKSAIAKIDSHNPALGYHLRHAVKTGSACSYLPDPTQPTIWTVDISAWTSSRPRRASRTTRRRAAGQAQALRGSPTS